MQCQLIEDMTLNRKLQRMEQQISRQCVVLLFVHTSSRSIFPLVSCPSIFVIINCFMHIDYHSILHCYAFTSITLPSICQSQFFSFRFSLFDFCYYWFFLVLGLMQKFALLCFHSRYLTVHTSNHSISPLVCCPSVSVSNHSPLGCHVLCDLEKLNLEMKRK